MVRLDKQLALHCYSTAEAKTKGNLVGQRLEQYVLTLVMIISSINKDWSGLPKTLTLMSIHEGQISRSQLLLPFTPHDEIPPCLL